MTILLSSFDFTSLIFLFSLVSSLNFNMHCCNEGEEEIYFALKIIHVFVHVYEACCGHSSVTFARKMKEVCNFDFIMGSNLKCPEPICVQPCVQHWDP